MGLSNFRNVSVRMSEGGLSMKGRMRLLLLAVAPVAAVLSAPAMAATQKWDPGLTTTGSDGAASWDLLTGDWASGGADGLWNNDGTSTATFGSGGTVGAVALGAPNLNVAGINFNLGYTIATTTDTLTLTAPAITVAPGQTAVINAPILGTAGLTVTGNLTLGTASMFTGDVNITAGSQVNVLGIDSGTAVAPNSFGPNSALGLTTAGSGNITVANGATLSLAATSANNSINFGSRVVFIAGAGTATGTTTGTINYTGAIINPASNNREFDAFEFITLTADATICGNRMDIGRDGDGVHADVLDLAGHTLTINMNNVTSQPVFGIEAAGNGKGNTVGTTVTSGQIDVVKGSLDIELNAAIANDGTSAITFENTGSISSTGANVEFFKTDGVSLTRPMIFKGNNIIGPGAAATASTVASNMTIMGNIVFETDVSGIPSTANPGVSLTITGNIVESGASCNVSQLGASTTILAGTNNWTGITDIEKTGILSLASAGALPTGANVNFGNAAGLGGTLDLGGFNATVSVLTVTGASSATSIIGNSSTTAPSILIYAGNIANPSTFSGTIQDSVSTFINVAGTPTARAGTQTTGLRVSSGSLSLSGPNTYSGNTNINAGGTLTVTSAGSLSATTPVINNGVLNLASSQSLASLSGTGTTNLTANAVTIGGTSSSGPIADAGSAASVTITGMQTVASVNVGTVVANGTLAIASNAVPALSKVSILTIAGSYGGSASAASTWTGGVDLTNSRLIVEDSSGTRAADLDMLRNQALVTNTVGGTVGIFSSTANGFNTTAGKIVKVVAVSDNAARIGTFPAGSTNFGGVNNVDASSILITATYKGDANLDGVVDIQDLTAVANHWQQPVTDWSQGDFDNSDFVDIQDLTAVANNWQAGVGSGGGSSFGDALSLLPTFGGTAAAPEPTSLAMLGIGGLLLRSRRQRKN